MGSCVSRDLFTSAHKNCPRPQGTDLLNRDLPSSQPPAFAPDHVAGKDKQMDFCWDPWQRCFQTTNGYISDSRSCPSNYSVAALATSSLVGVVQSIKDHITKPTAMARGRVAHLIEWKGWSAHQSGWELSPAEDEHYCCLPDELREARFAAGVAEQFAITEATLSAWSSLDDELQPEDSTQGAFQLQDLESIYLQDSLLSGPSQDDSLLACSPGLTLDDGWPSPEEPPSPPQQQQHRQRLPGAHGPEGGAHEPEGGAHGPEGGAHGPEGGAHGPEGGAHGPEGGAHEPEGGAHVRGSMASVDSGSLSEEEDEVFYN